MKSNPSLMTILKFPKHARYFVLALAFSFGLANAPAQQPGIPLKFSTDRIMSGDWRTVYTHVKEGLQMKVEPVTGQPFDYAATLVLSATSTQEFSGKATYFRSRPFHVESSRFTVEWYENVVDGIAGPSFELWGEMGASPNQMGHMLLQLSRSPDGLKFGSDIFTSVKPGWQHFKVVVSVADNTFDVYCNAMDKPVASGAPLKEKIENTEHLGVGFILYLGAGVPPSKWQIGGVSILPQ